MEGLISVIIPVYNGHKTIEKAITSVLLQSYPNIQIIIVDDYSTDDTRDIIQRISEKEPRICFFKNKINLGVAETRNFAINQASGEYIAFLDSDDEWYPNKLQLQLEHLNQMKADMCYTAYEMVDNSQSKTCKKKMIPVEVDYKSLLKENFICWSSVLVKKEVLKENPFTKKYFHEDFVLSLELLREERKLVGLPEYLVRYTKGGRSADKINAMKRRWQIYRKCEMLNLFKSIYYFCFYGINGIRKYYINTNQDVHIRENEKQNSFKAS